MSYVGQQTDGQIDLTQQHNIKDNNLCRKLGFFDKIKKKQPKICILIIIP